MITLDFFILGKQKNRTRNPNQEKLSAAGEARLKSTMQHEYEFYSFIKQRFAKLKQHVNTIAAKPVNSVQLKSASAKSIVDNQSIR